MRAGALPLLAAVVLLAATGPAVAADNSPPLPNAGVDQTVSVNSTVYLDANGSVDPDGDIANVSWAVETPAGDTTTPACRDCRRTDFDADAVGRYTVTLTVTDDDGATRTDTLYVTVTNERGPSVSLSGPNSTASGTNATFTASASRDRASLQSLTWLVNGSVVDRESLNGSSATVSFTHSFSKPMPVRAVVYDTLGERGSDTRWLSISSGGGNAGGSVGESQCFDQLCGNGSDATYTRDGVTIVADTNNMEGLQTYKNGELITIKNPTDSSKISEGPNGQGYQVEGGLGSVNTESLNTKKVKSRQDSSSATGESSGRNDFPGGVMNDIVSDASDEQIDSVTNDDGSYSVGGITFGGSSSGSGDNDSGGGSSDSRTGIMFQ